MGSFFDIISNKPFKIFYNTIIPRKKRKEWGFRYSEIPAQNQVAEYWHSVIQDYTEGKINKYDFQPIKELHNKKIIWQYWAQGIENAHSTAKLCFASVDKYKDDYEVIRITDDNLSEYLDFPDFVMEKRNNPEFRAVFFSDLLRVALINTYGGIWLDASILLTDAIPKKYEGYDFFMFSRDPKSINKHWGKDDGHFYFSWREDFKVNYLNSIIYGYKNGKLSSIVLNLLMHFWENETKIPYYFFFQIMINEIRSMKVVAFDFPIADDTLPHLLQGQMNQKYNEKEYEHIKESASLHKLSLHEKLKKKDIMGHITYYGFLTDYFNLE